MYRLIKNCLEKAVEHEAKSIAFPTLGCGRLGFHSSQVVDCFLKAIEKSHSDLRVSTLLFYSRQNITSASLKTSESLSLAVAILH